MTFINISNLTFAYEGSYDNIFSKVSFRIDSDWKLGFIGRNGRGKTTFLQLLLGKYSYLGKIDSSIEFEYFPYIIPNKEMNTIDVIHSINNSIEIWKLKKELSLLRVSEDVLYQTFNSLSLGEQNKVMIATLFLKENNFLLIDEPTNHLDIEGRKIVSEYLNSKKGFILVSHDKNFLDNCVDHILSINNTNISVHKGNFSTWQENKFRQDYFELTENEKLKKDIKRLEQSKRRTANWSDKLEASKIGSGAGDRGRIGHLAAKMMKRSKATEFRQNRAIDDKAKLLKNIEISKPISIKPISYHKEVLIRITDLAISYDEKEIFSDLRFTVKRGDRIAIKGKNGCGKTSLIKLILGENISYKGYINVGSNLVISTVTQDTEYLKGTLKDYINANNIEESLFKTILRKFGFSRIMFDKNIDNYSEGQKKKVLLAKSLSEQAHLYIWDEPLNYIDILSRIQIERLILKYCPTMLFVEHDSYVINTIANKVIEIGEVKS